MIFLHPSSSFHEPTTKHLRRGFVSQGTQYEEGVGIELLGLVTDNEQTIVRSLSATKPNNSIPKRWDEAVSYLSEGVYEKSRSLDFAIFHFDGDHCELQIPMPLE